MNNEESNQSNRTDDRENSTDHCKDCDDSYKHQHQVMFRLKFVFHQFVVTHGGNSTSHHDPCSAAQQSKVTVDFDE